MKESDASDVATATPATAWNGSPGIDVSEWNRRAMARREERAVRAQARAIGLAKRHAIKAARLRLANQDQPEISPPEEY